MDQATINKFLEAYSRLLVFDLQKRVGGAHILVIFDAADARFLVRVASALAFGPSSPGEEVEAQWKMWAYDVTTRIAIAWAEKDPRFRQAAELILARLGNFPGRQFLRNQYHKKGARERYPPTLLIESLMRESENTISFQDLGDRTLTDFQFRLIQSLRQGRPISISAPTSAGKSFALSLDITDAIAKGAAKAVAYIVPTRALIRQVMQDLLKHFRDAGLQEVAVSAAPTPVELEQVNKGVVYVLTQERLMSLLYASNGEPILDRIYVDEAQEIGDQDRGMLLHSAIQEVIIRFPSAQVCFASPLTSNPDFLLAEFNLKNRGESFIERQSPVSQAVVVLRKVKGEKRVIRIFVLTPTGLREVATTGVSFEFGSGRERLAEVAKLFTGGNESSVIYANGPADAIKIALHLSSLIDEKTRDPEVRDLVDFVRSHIHPQYALVDTLLKGVAFHYGKMPHLVRSRIEDLLRDRKIKYVVATSTLLQGVNLPAKNIFILEPKKGSGNPMKGPDFWNLAGRAGRLLENFNGTIWCIDPSEWELNPLDEPKLSEMKSSFRESLKDDVVRNALLAVVGGGVPLNKVNERERVEHVFGKVFSEFTCQDLNVAQSPYAEGADIRKLAEIDSKCRELLGVIEIPKDVCRRNCAISPLSLDKLWKHFRQTDRIESIVPLDPNRTGSLDRMREIFKLVDEIFVGTERERWKYFAPLAFYWIKGSSLKELIADYLRHYIVAPERDATNAAIRDFLYGLEQILRFEYVKYLKAYNDVLETFLKLSGRDDLLKTVSPLHLYIEFGARDRVVVVLMSLGISRTTAILIRSAITSGDDISRNECWVKLRQLRLDRLDIPNVCKAEIRQLTGTQ